MGQRRQRASPPRGVVVVERVLEVALEELASVGYDAFNVPRVADAANVNKTSVYRRWASKPVLVAAAIERALGHAAPVPDTGALHNDMRAFATATAEWVSSSTGRAVLRMLMSTANAKDLHALTTLLMQGQASAPALIFQRAVQRGELRADADVHMALTVVAGAMLQRIFIENHDVTTEFVDRLLRMVLAGLSPQGSSLLLEQHVGLRSL
jgi:AcrR family transcriptional regulator